MAIDDTSAVRKRDCLGNCARPVAFGREASQRTSRSSPFTVPHGGEVLPLQSGHPPKFRKPRTLCLQVGVDVLTRVGAQHELWTTRWHHPLAWVAL